MNQKRSATLLLKIALGLLLQLFWVGIFLQGHPNQSLPGLLNGVSHRLVLTIQKTAASFRPLHQRSGFQKTMANPLATVSSH